MSLDSFGRWLEQEELAGHEEAGRITAGLIHVVRRIVDKAGDLDGRRVLDLGTGTGVVAVAAADRGARVVGVDAEEEDLARGRAVAARLGASIRHVAADARALPVAEASFEVSVHRSVLIYMDRAPDAVAEERRVLRPGGRVSCSESLGAAADLRSDDPGIANVWTGLRSLLAQAEPHSYSFSQDDLAGLYRDAGFEDVRVEREDREIVLDTSAAVVRTLVRRPAAGLSAREYLERTGVPGEFLDEFLARLILAADEGRPARLLAPEGFLTARRD